MGILKEKNVFVCINGDVRSRELASEAMQVGIQARSLRGGKRWILEVKPTAVHAAIKQDELVILVTEANWPFDQEATEKVVEVLDGLHMRHSQADFLSLLKEITSRRSRPVWRS